MKYQEECEMYVDRCMWPIYMLHVSSSAREVVPPHNILRNSEPNKQT